MDSFLSGIEGIDDLSQILLPTIQLTDILDIVAVAALIYLVLIWIRKTRGWMLFRGIAIVLGAWIVAMILNLNMVELVFRSLKLIINLIKGEKIKLQLRLLYKETIEKYINFINDKINDNIN